MIIFLLCVVVAFGFIYFRFFKTTYKFTFDAITFFEGPLGCGKTTMLVVHSLIERNKRIFQNFFIRFFNLFRSKKKRKKLRGLNIYSTFPIWINKRVGFSFVVNSDVIRWLYRIKEDCIVVLDEVAYLFPSETSKTDKRTIFCLTWFRHATNGLVLSASQSLSECNKTFRSKVCRVFHLSGCKSGFFRFAHVNVREAIISEDMNNVYIDDKEHNKQSNQNIFRFKFPSKHFDSRYARLLYELPDNIVDLLSNNYNLCLKAMGLKNGDKWQYLGYDFRNYKENLRDIVKVD